MPHDESSPSPVDGNGDRAVAAAFRRGDIGGYIDPERKVGHRGYDRKRYTWPQYAVGARARHECPFVVIVVTPDAATARWASEPIELGGGNLYRTYVVGPQGIPVIVDPDRAVREPELTRPP